MKSPLFSSPFRLDAVWLLAPIVGVIAAASLSPIPPYDYWWHLVMGRLIAAGQPLPDSNLFLYTMAPDAPFFNQPWLGQLLMYLGFDAGGPELTILLRNLLVALTFGIVFRIAYVRSESARAVGALGLVFAISTFPVLTVRTRMFAFVPYALLLAWVVGYATGKGRRWSGMFVAALGVAFWANTHGSFILAPAIALGITGCVFLQMAVGGELSAGAIRERVDLARLGEGALATALFAIAGVVNPYGPAVYTYVLDLAVRSTVSSTVTEWRPPDIHDPIGAFFLVGVTVSVVFLAWRRRHVQVWEAGLLLVTTYLASSAVRSIFFWAPAVIIVLAPHLAAIWTADEAPTPSQGRFNAALALGVVLFGIALQPGLGREALVAATHGEMRRAEPGRAIFSAETPLSVLARIENDQRIFHHQAIGGLVEFAMTTESSPAQVAFVDQRMELVPEKVWNAYFAISAAKDDWQSRLDAHGVNVLILQPKTQWALIQEALKSPLWRFDGYEESFVVFQRRTPLNATQSR